MAKKETRTVARQQRSGYKREAFFLWLIGILGGVLTVAGVIAYFALTGVAVNDLTVMVKSDIRVVEQVLLLYTISRYLELLAIVAGAGAVVLVVIKWKWSKTA